MVDAMTDNRNRTVAEIRHIFSKNGGNMGESGSVGWMFNKKGYIVVDKAAKSEDELFEIAIEAGADDVRPEPFAEVITDGHDLPLTRWARAYQVFDRGMLTDGDMSTPERQFIGEF